MATKISNNEISEYEELAVQFFILFDELSEEEKVGYFESKCPDIKSKLAFLEACNKLYNDENVKRVIVSLDDDEKSLEDKLVKASRFLSKIREFVGKQITALTSSHELLVEALSRGFKPASTEIKVPKFGEENGGKKLAREDNKNNGKKRPDYSDNYKAQIVKTQRLGHPCERG